MDIWTEIKIEINAEDIDLAADIAQMTVPYGIYIEDYRTLEEEAMEIAHIDLIDEDLLAKDRSKGYVHIYLEPEMNAPEAVAFLTERYKAANIKFKVDTIPCKREDWQDNWKQFFKPMPVGEKLLIQPTWEDLPDDLKKEDRKILHIEPGLAFGTGSHNTTRLCLETLERYIKGGESVLDLGCGSGILGIASLLLGADRVEGVDIDELAVKTAIENGKENGYFEPQYKIHCGDMTDKVSGKFNIVVANIVADIIIMFSENAMNFMDENAVFITSGIIDSRESDVLEAFNKNGFEIIERIEDGGWLCFVLKH
ncbi:MAG: 50S ribosomal protein L11 methyltransferase [Oscillospiraceae bacterium]|nr:50S ribosomal protein L11 methyltransferase [Oscillospiraceae bacterium]